MTFPTFLENLLNCWSRITTLFRIYNFANNRTSESYFKHSSLFSSQSQVSALIKMPIEFVSRSVFTKHFEISLSYFWLLNLTKVLLFSSLCIQSCNISIFSSILDQLTIREPWSSETWVGAITPCVRLRTIHINLSTWNTFDQRWNQDFRQPCF